MSLAKQLEQYTIDHPGEVLLVTLPDNEIMIFKGFSSSLTSPTAPDPDIPVLPEGAEIIKIDRLQSPYNPVNPVYLQANLTLEEMKQLL
ncbi:MAG: hypothetical protein N5P05_000665 [Chroococcopsis gigantea SAG 12.99]|jgi:hypothetical protein|nr:hypothetical protein [Chlorogloea purpurea SAG 13.99]MDV2999059.1 hypothetical protein [Chroococcopsis gigantea SAG 12.99]